MVCGAYLGLNACGVSMWEHEVGVCPLEIILNEDRDFDLYFSNFYPAIDP